VPVSGIKLEQCVLLARQAGLEIWRRYGVPVFFYESAAARPDRRISRMSAVGNLKVFATQQERKRLAGRTWAAPDLHPTAGACAVWRTEISWWLYNNLFDSSDVSIVRAVAREIRAASRRSEVA